MLFYRNGGYSVVTAFGTQHVDKRPLARPHTVCEIALGTYVSVLQMELPAAGGTTFFKAEVDITWTVTDPHLAAIQVVTDVAQQLTAPVRRRLSEVSSAYRVTQAEQAGRAITTQCAGGRWAELGTELGLRVQLYVRLRLDDRTIEHKERVRDARPSAEMAREHQAARRMLLGEELEQLSHRLAADPEAAKDFLEKIRQEGRQDERERVIQLINLLNQGSLDSVRGIGSVPVHQQSQQLEPSPEGALTLDAEAGEPRRRPRRTDGRSWAEEDAETSDLPTRLGQRHPTPTASYSDRDRQPSVPPAASSTDAVPPPTPPTTNAGANRGEAEPRQLVAELAEQTAPGREVPLHVQIVRDSGRDERGVQMRPFFLPPDGARVLITIHAPGLVVIDELQQELHVVPGRDSDVLRFRLKAPTPGLHQVTVRAFRGGTFLGEVTCQLSVEHSSVTRDGPQRHARLPSMAFDPGEITLQVLKDEAAGTFSFQLISETFYAPEIFHFRAGDPRQATEQIYAELRRAARAAATVGGDGDASRLRARLRNHGVQLWTSAVPQAVQGQFWDEADNITAFTVLGAHDIVPWELLYPLNEEREDRGFLAEWLPVVRRVFGQDRVRSLRLPEVAFVVPPGSPADAGQEVTSLRARLGTQVADIGVLSERAALTALIEGGHAGLLHFACHNAFTGAGSCVTMADGPFDPIDLASAAQLRTLRPHRPLVFFNACRSAGEIDWFGESLGWAPQFLNAGAGAFVGTLWPVRSRSALQFAEAFYDQLITHRQPLGQASLAARQTIRDLHGGDPTWLAYAVYGSPAATAHTTV
ncbi:CHAT domain-containing protein [Streptomyces zhihengii]|uniref:CHAT domain-containing protein n=1 Tax=Streptomyces zhihengii TaxID=1818004 RepID=UPI003633173A